jgi:NAD+ kinase
MAQDARMPLSRLGLVVHGGKQLARDTATRVRRWGEDRDVEVVDLDVWSREAERRHASEEMAAAGELDLVVTVGGDGTYLRGLRLAAAVDVPVLGIDVGRVGFLTDIEAVAAIEALEAFAAGEASIEERLTLTLRASRPLEVPHDVDLVLSGGRGPSLPPPPAHVSGPEEQAWGVALDVTALNDVVFEKLSRDRQVSLAVYIGGRRFIAYSADALVVATPTGSTAYSFSAGGPVVSPRAEAVVFTPVAAHMVFDRSLVVAADEPVAVRVLERSARVVVSVDGQVRGVLEPGDWVGVHARRWRARLVRLADFDFFDRVRDRFGLVDAPAAAADGGAPPVWRPGVPVPDELRHLHLPDAP